MSAKVTGELRKLSSDNRQPKMFGIGGKANFVDVIGRGEW